MAAQPMGAKLLLMGRAGAGKTSMKSIIFANYLARDTNRLQTTNFIEHSSLKFLGNLRLNLWDCGGQDNFMENYFETQRQNIFQNAEVLIYVVAVSDRSGQQADNAKEQKNFVQAMESLREYSPNARVFCLVHKLDLVHESKREEVFQSYERELTNNATGMNIKCFGTSIWDETLFKAWSQIVYSLIPDVNKLGQHLHHIGTICEADEVVLFEKNTFLVISHASMKTMQDSHRFEKISNIVKQFKLSCGKAKTSFQSFQVKNSVFTAYIEPFLNHSFIMVVVSDPDVLQAATSANLWAARNHFSQIAQSGESFGAHL